MNKRDTPVSWCNAKILSVNGCTYTVQYDCYPGQESELIGERVSRKFIRPRPPPVQGIENCVAGDIVEVFHGISWKLATILKVLHGYQYLVRLLGCSQELIVKRTNIRMRQRWHDDKRIVMPKVLLLHILDWSSFSIFALHCDSLIPLRKLIAYMILLSFLHDTLCSCSYPIVSVKFQCLWASDLKGVLLASHLNWGLPAYYYYYWINVLSIRYQF